MTGEKSTEERAMLKLTEPQERAFWSEVKIGIYKELHRKGLITDSQLGRLIAAQKGQQRAGEPM